MLSLQIAYGGKNNKLGKQWTLHSQNGIYNIEAELRIRVY